MSVTDLIDSYAGYLIGFLGLLFGVWQTFRNRRYKKRDDEIERRYDVYTKIVNELNRINQFETAHLSSIYPYSMMEKLHEIGEKQKKYKSERETIKVNNNRARTLIDEISKSFESINKITIKKENDLTKLERKMESLKSKFNEAERLVDSSVSEQFLDTFSEIEELESKLNYDLSKLNSVLNETLNGLLSVSSLKIVSSQNIYTMVDQFKQKIIRILDLISTSEKDIVDKVVTEKYFLLLNERNQIEDSIRKELRR